jgi:hypothetical protein
VRKCTSEETNRLGALQETSLSGVGRSVSIVLYEQQVDKEDLIRGFNHLYKQTRIRRITQPFHSPVAVEDPWIVEGVGLGARGLRRASPPAFDGRASDESAVVTAVGRIKADANNLAGPIFILRFVV